MSISCCRAFDIYRLCKEKQIYNNFNPKVFLQGNPEKGIFLYRKILKLYFSLYNNPFNFQSRFFSRTKMLSFHFVIPPPSFLSNFKISVTPFFWKRLCVLFRKFFKLLIHFFITYKGGVCHLFQAHDVFNSFRANVSSRFHRFLHLLYSCKPCRRKLVELLYKLIDWYLY